MISATQHAPFASLLAVVAASVVSFQQLQPGFSSAPIVNTPFRAAGRLSAKQLPLLSGSSSDLDVRHSPFNAKCDWDGDRGTDDTVAFTAAAAGASKVYLQ